MTGEIRKLQTSKEPSGQPSEEKGITRVDLSKYEFSPPGPMGWTAKEYEKMVENLRKMEEE